MARTDQPHSHAHDDHHDAGLAHDLRVLSRRRWIGMLAKTAAGLSLVPVFVRCTTRNDGGVDASSSTAPDANATSAAGCTTIPEETGGPYPGDGTNGPDALALSGIVRSDIRTSIAGATGTAEGVELTVAMSLVDSATCSPLVGYAVYIWHCTRDGDYSMYTGAAAQENYLRGVQMTDASGQVSFTTIFPGCYSGRWPHIHLEVYPSVAQAISASDVAATSQLAMSKATCDAVYATDGYSASVANLAQTSLATDMVFADGATLELPAMTGSVASGLTATITIAV